MPQHSPIGASASEYWRVRPAQKLYIAFCLLMSSIQDALLGMCEAEKQNHNWSATCSYYSLVHAGRLLSFVATGDYPKHHAELSRLFSPEARPRSENEPSGRREGDRSIRLDWLRGFLRDRRDQSSATVNGGNARMSDISEYLKHKLGVSAADTRLTTIGRLLKEACKLRNDSNYESLLIAHEHSHETMRPAFHRLAAALSVACKHHAVPIAIDCFDCMMFGMFAGSTVAQDIPLVKELQIIPIWKRSEICQQANADFDAEG
jgi:hypothetical protein